MATLIAVSLLVGATFSGVGIAASDSPQFSENVYQIYEGETGTVTITMPDGTDRTTFILDGESDPASDLRVEATVVDADGDGTVSIDIDTTDISADGISAQGADELEDLELSNVPEDGILPKGDHDIYLGSTEAPADAGTIYVNGPSSAEPSETPTPEPTATATPKHVDGTVIVHDGRYVTVGNTTDATIRGETHAAPGTELSVAIKSAGETIPRFFERKSVTVSEDGTFTATFDLSEQRGGPEQVFDISVDRDGEELTTATGRISSCSDCATTTAAAPDDGDTDEVAFSKDAYHVVQTREVTLPITLGDESAVTVVIGDEETTGYELVVTLTDAQNSADGRTKLSLDTEPFGNHPVRIDRSASDDDVQVVQQTELSTVLDEGAYQVALYAGDGQEGEPVDTTTLTLHEPLSYEERKSLQEQAQSTATDAQNGESSQADADSQSSHESDDSSPNRLVGIGGLIGGGGLGLAGILLLLRTVR